MQFQVPQFIDVEDKIFGPFTLKQFIYLAGGAAGIFLAYVFLPLFLVILIAPAIGAFAGALAFYKVNNQPFIKVVEQAIKHFKRNKIYIWKKREIKARAKMKTSGPQAKTAEETFYVPKLTKSKLSDLAWSLDIKKKNGV